LSGGKRSRLPPRPAPQIDAAVWSQAAFLRRQEAALREPRSFARFLCGVSSPGLSRAKLPNHPLFGALGDVPFPTVMQKAEEQ
jgi:ATP-dependent DNA helicase RecQ